MAAKYFVFIFLITLFQFIRCPYPPVGDEVQPGSVLLPASRRGRYLANIVRRQAVDGTGIKFNKDADRMNAEAKKKVDVLSEDLLPYIIAEQERRTTLHKRVMNAIQNGEKGVTIAEIRNKPPLLIRKSMMYRCPSNRAPKEPDGSGVLMCEDDIIPTLIMYDSCLSVQDRELYNADNKYFFCNRHKVEGPDLPRNGSTVIGCAPTERTSLNYTMTKCTLEDTEDVVVHFRYYPDRTYKYVTELDPDREVCDHWNPCQIGYIYSIPSPDRAVSASDLWRDVVERPDEYERDEIVPPVPEDSQEEGVHPSATDYITSPRKLQIPEGGEYSGVRVKDTNGNLRKLNDKHVDKKIVGDNSKRTSSTSVIIKLIFAKWKTMYFGTYFVAFKMASTGKEKLVNLLALVQSAAHVVPSIIDSVHGQKKNRTEISFTCNRCRVSGIMIRSTDDNVYNLDNSKYRLTELNNNQGKPQQFIELDLKGLKPQDFGDYFAIIQNGDGMEERVKVATISSPEKDTDNLIPMKRLTASLPVGGHYDTSITYSCAGCEPTDILCNGESVLAAGRVSIIAVSMMISFNFPRFEDENSCVYMGFFKLKDKTYRKILATIDNDSGVVTVDKLARINPPPENKPFQQTITYSCDDCTVEKVAVNGVNLESQSRRSFGGAAFYEASSTQIVVLIPDYKSTFEGVYQAVFRVGGDAVTKTIMEIGDEEGGEDTNKDTTEEHAATTTADADHEATTAAPAEGEAKPEEGEAKPEDGEANSDQGANARRSIKNNTNITTTSSKPVLVTTVAA